MEKKNSSLTYSEIYGQADSFAAINAALPAIFATLDKVFAEPYDELIFTGCGTSLYLAQTAAHAWCAYNATPAKAVCCSERYFFPEVYLKGERVLVLPITRKSYTTEVRMAIDKARTFPGLKSLAITCDKDSEQYNDAYILSPETAEDSVIMTRSFTSMVYLAVIMSMYAGGKRDEIDAMADYPANARRLLVQMDNLARDIIGRHHELNLFITLGQGLYYGVANECMNHPAALEDDAKLLRQMKSYGAVTAAIGDGVAAAMLYADYTLELGCGYNAQQNAALIGFIRQFLGYYIAEKKNIDADSPRHLTQAIVLDDK